jgi:hypothetical protein
VQGIALPPNCLPYFDVLGVNLPQNLQNSPPVGKSHLNRKRQRTYKPFKIGFTELPFIVQYGQEWNWFSTEFNKFPERFKILKEICVCVIRIKDYCEMRVLQSASVAELSQAFLADFYDPTSFGIPNYSEFQLFWNSFSSLVHPSSVSEIPIPNGTSKFHKPLVKIDQKLSVHMTVAMKNPQTVSLNYVVVHHKYTQFNNLN